MAERATSPRLRTLGAVASLTLLPACDGSGPVDVPPAGEFEILWSRAYDSPPDAGIEVAGGRVIVSEGEHVVGLDPRDGSETWRVAVGPFGFFEAEIASDGDTVFAFQSATAAAIGGSDGAVLWRNSEIPVGGVPRIDGDRVFGLSRGVVTALDRATGAVVWARDIERASEGFVSAAANDVCVVTNTLVLGPSPPEEMVCLDRGDGRIRWRFEDPRLVVSRGIVVADGRAIVGTGDGWILAVDLDTGELAWDERLPAALQARITEASGRLIACTSDRRGSPACVALRPSDGSRLWTEPVSNVFEGAPVVVGGVVWVVDAGTLVGLDLATGNRVHGPIPSPERFFRGTPAVESGVAYVASFDRLYAIRIGR